MGLAGVLNREPQEEIPLGHGLERITALVA